MDTIEFENGRSITTVDAKPSIRSQRHAAWVRLGTVGWLQSEWQCSACLNVWVVNGIFTPKGLGYDECPSCHVKMVNVHGE